MPKVYFTYLFFYFAQSVYDNYWVKWTLTFPYYVLWCRSKSEYDTKPIEFVRDWWIFEVLMCSTDWGWRSNLILSPLCIFSTFLDCTRCSWLITPLLGFIMTSISVFHYYYTSIGLPSFEKSRLSLIFVDICIIFSLGDWHTCQG